MNIDQKLALKGTCKECYGEITFKWELYKHLALNVKPTDMTNMKKVENLDKISTTRATSLNLALKKNVLPKDTGYTAIFRAFRRNGQFGEYIHTFVTNSPPENGK